MIEDLEEKQWEFIFAVNAKGTFLVTQAFLPHMKQQKYGRIVNIASIGGKRGAPGQSVYCSSKGAVLEFTRVLAMEAGPYGITANSVCPGIILTEMGAQEPGGPGKHRSMDPGDMFRPTGRSGGPSGDVGREHRGLSLPAGRRQPRRRSDPLRSIRPVGTEESVDRGNAARVGLPSMTSLFWPQLCL
jgi:NAD(P)-dependent dehydrogenase (short-subunit alcohol dehydrogenase family)